MKDDCQPDNPSTHDTITVGESKDARINYAGDTDWFRADFTGGSTYTVEASRAEGARPLAFPKVLIYDSQGRMVMAGEWNSGKKSSTATFTPGQHGTYFVVVRSIVDLTGIYNVSLSEQS